MSNRKYFTLIACMLITALGQVNCFADDTEVFFGTIYSSRSEEPNVLLVLDTSGSMDDTIPASRQQYDPTVTYTANSTDASSCNQSPEYVWFTTSGTPTCSSNNKIPLSQFYCSFATNSGGNLASGGIGIYTNYVARWRKQSSSYSWSSNLTSSSSGNTTYYPHITCKNHIQNSNQYATSSTTSSDSNKWNGSSNSNYWSSNTGTSATFYSQNYVKYLNDSTQVIPATTKMTAMKNAATEVISSLNNMNVGLMTYDTNGAGGFVRREIAPIDDESQRSISFSGSTSSCSTSTNNSNATTNCTLSIQTQPSSGSIAIGQVITSPSSLACALIKTGSGNTWTITKTALNTSNATLTATSQTTLNSSSKMTDIINCFIPNGSTPLTETLYEAYKYFTGGSITFGNNSSPHYSVAKSRTNQSMTSNTYDSPMDNTCQNNYLVYLTDGMPTNDTGADSSIWSLTGTNTNICHGDTSPAFGCAGILSKYMYENDLRTTINGRQNVATSFIAFGADVSQSTFEAAASAAGGDAFGASDYDQLSSVFRTVFNNVLDTNSTFTSPSIAVNAFNKTQVLEDMYVAMFKPETSTHWDGNLKKFKLRNSQIVGRGSTLDSVDTANAVGADGFFTNTTKDFWEALGADNSNLNITTKGGAANKIPAPSSRKVYTYIGSNRPSSFTSLSSHLFSTGNTAITDNLLGTNTSCDTSTTTDNPCRATLINFVRGDGDGNPSTTTDTRHIMGDAVHSQPAVVIYGNSSCTPSSTNDCEIDNLNDAVVFVATNDGFLHAIRPYSTTDSSNGEEIWSFIPQEIIPDLLNVYRDNPLSSFNAKHYSLDGDIRVLKYDINSDGKVDTSAGDRVFIYFSQGRGGDNYYALDVTDKNDPKFMWSLDRSNNSPNNLPAVSKSWSTPTLGRVNISGATQNPQKLVLIFGGGYDDEEDSIDFRSSDSYGNAIYMVDAVKGTVLWSQTKTGSGAFARMTHAIPSNITVLDTDNNGYSDRMYVGDMAGQLWRFDITNGSTAGSLVTGGVIASLGAKEITNGSETTLRKNNRTFYNAPDVSMMTSTSGSNYYNIAIGSGDRARPKSNTITEDYFFSLRDYNLSAMTQSAYNSLVSDPLTIGDLTTIDGDTDKTSNITSGWKLPLDTTLHEKSIAQSATINGNVMFTTFISNTSVDSCTATTGYNRTYTVKLASGLKYFTDPDTTITTDGNGLYEQFNTTGLPSQINIVNMGNIKKTIPNEQVTSTKTKTGTCLSGVSILDSCVEFGSRLKAFWQDTGSN